MLKEGVLLVEASDLTSAVLINVPLPQSAIC